MSKASEWKGLVDDFIRARLPEGRPTLYLSSRPRREATVTDSGGVFISDERGEVSFDGDHALRLGEWLVEMFTDAPPSVGRAGENGGDDTPQGRAGQ